MQNPLTRYLNDCFIQPAVEKALSANHPPAYGVSHTHDASLREAIADPRVTNSTGRSTADGLPSDPVSNSLATAARTQPPSTSTHASYASALVPSPAGSPPTAERASISLDTAPTTSAPSSAAEVISISASPTAPFLTTPNPPKSTSANAACVGFRHPIAAGCSAAPIGQYPGPGGHWNPQFTPC